MWRIRSTKNCLVPLYLTALWRASWVTRKRHSEISFGRCLGTFLSVNSMFTWCCLENSVQNDLIAVTTPRKSSVEEWSWWERD